MDDAIRSRQIESTMGRRSDGGSSRVGELLSTIDSPADVRGLSVERCVALCREIREYIVDVVSQHGGHLGASLGVVELTVALHRALDLPHDRLVWDTGHQAYVHKVLTGRREALWRIRRKKGISGFLKRTESAYDAFGAGHASTAISAALGMAAARDLTGESRNVVAVIGDGAMTGGLAYEALNNAGQSGRPLLVVLNDNGMSIAPNVGALAQYLTGVTTNKYMMRLREEVLSIVKKLPMGSSVGEVAERVESGLKNVLVPGALFEALGFRYYGPVDGHDLPALVDLVPKLLTQDRPVLLHALTRKGKGLAPAEADDEGFHGVTPFDKRTGRPIAVGTAGPPSYTRVFGDAVVDEAKARPDVVAITAAMPTGTGLNTFKAAFPDRFHDVGIAEAHAVCFAAGLACDGARPVVAIYSTFLQRAFDQVVHDVALQRLPVVFAIDRAGLVGADGPTHHGVLDLSYLRCVPGLVVAAPKDGNELRDLLRTALEHDGPFALRYPRGGVPDGFDDARAPVAIPIGAWESLREGADAAILAVGTMVGPALEAAELLAERGVHATVVNARFVKPLDLARLRVLRRTCRVIVTVEENNLPGGFGDGVVAALEADGLRRDGVARLGLPDDWVAHGTRGELLEEVGLTADRIVATVVDRLSDDTTGVG